MRRSRAWGLRGSGLGAGIAMGIGLLACSSGGGGSDFVDVGPSPPVTPPPEGQGGSGGLVRVVPTDTRPVINAETPPPPISGGTLAVTSDGAFVVAADPDRDRVLIVDAATRTVVQEIALNPGDEPGRVVAGPGQEAFVALRRGGAVVTVDPTLGLLARRAACLAPRGLAYDAALDALHVACAEGQLVTFTAQAEVPTRVLSLDVDLRDVVVGDGGLYVSRMRSAELLELDAAGQVVQRRSPGTLLGSTPQPVSSAEASGAFADPAVVGTGGATSFVSTPFAPAVAWRTVRDGEGNVHMLHQRDQTSPVRIQHDDDDSQMVDPYGGAGNPCGGIVRSGVTRFGKDGSVHAELAPSLPLAVDAAISPNGRYIAIASAGLQDFAAPQPTFEFVDDGSGAFGAGGAAGIAMGGASPGFFGFSGVQVLALADATFSSGGSAPEPAPAPEPSVDGGVVAPAPLAPPTDPQLPPPADESADRCDFDQIGVGIGEPTTAVAFSPLDSSVLYAQTRSPAQLYIVDLISGIAELVPFGGSLMQDTAHDLFHRSASAGIACASCHPEGMDDGHVWNFEGLGLRRTQPLDVGLAGTAPFHWDGTLQSVSALMDEVFIGRMGGVFQSPERLAALESWLFQLRPLPPRRAADDALAQRGAELFVSEAVGCGTCHSGAALTNNLSYQVGTTVDGALLQVPGLHGIGYRSLLMHDGCASSLRERFDPACGGGDAHGVTSNLPPQDIDALVAYLETL